MEGEIASSTIKQASLDSFDVITLVTGIVNPVDITLDRVAEWLYWLTTGGVLEAISINSSEQTFVYSFPYEAPAGIAVFEDFIYVTLSANNTVARIDKWERDGVCTSYH